MAGLLISVIAGGLFGVGLVISEMINPARVLGFLDIAGTWDPTLAFVMGGALAVSIAGYWLARRRSSPVLTPKSHIPQHGAVDARLILGAVLFGTGWGLAGFCPGPALVAVATGEAKVLIFVAAMAGGMWLAGRISPN